jgi:glycine/serine hydroxymethyltransferase
MKTDEMKRVGAWILEVLKHTDNDNELARIRGAIAEFAKEFAVPGIG